MWKSVKENSNTSKSKTPQSLIFNKQFVNSPKQIANIVNTFYLNKIKQIHINFRHHKLLARYILRFFIPRNENKFDLPLLTTEQTCNLIKKAKNSWMMCGHDLSMNMLK